MMLERSGPVANRGSLGFILKTAATREVRTIPVVSKKAGGSQTGGRKTSQGSAIHSSDAGGLDQDGVVKRKRQIRQSRSSC